jgi:calcineurin-like phosphoesterase family protein
MNVIGDIAGNYKTLMALLEKMPSDVPVSLGDMCDRGPKSQEVFDFFMNKGQAILGNHEHMMIDFYEDTKIYDYGIWFSNGGGPTHRQIFSYSEKYVKWLKSLPKYLRIEVNEQKYFLSHAPWNSKITLDQACNPITFNELDYSIIWNRGSIKKIDKTIQIHGHNSLKEYKEFKDNNGELFGINLDSSRGEKLTGYNTRLKKFYTQEYID